MDKIVGSLPVFIRIEIKLFLLEKKFAYKTFNYMKIGLHSAQHY